MMCHAINAQLGYVQKQKANLKWCAAKLVEEYSVKKRSEEFLPPPEWYAR
jgi:hypothetical protein